MRARGKNYAAIDKKCIFTNIAMHPSFVTDLYNIIYLIKVKFV
jgi:hypothetical protein